LICSVRRCREKVVLPLGPRACVQQTAREVRHDKSQRLSEEMA
jgi:hypothetical protein